MNNSDEVITCPYCSEEIFATAKKCKHCGEWLTEDAQRSPKSANVSTETVGIKREGLLRIPRGSKFWGWFAGITVLSTVRVILQGKEVDSALFTWDLLLFWGFLLFVQYMKNFKQEIPLLKFLPWCFLANAIMDIVLKAKMSDEDYWLLSTVLFLGLLVFILCIARQLMKFSEEPTGGVKNLGSFMFVAYLTIIITWPFFVFYYEVYEVSEEKSMIDWINEGWDIVAVSIVIYILLARVFYKARRYNELHLREKTVEVEKRVEDRREEVLSVQSPVVLEQENAEKVKVQKGGKKRLSKHKIGIFVVMLLLVAAGIGAWRIFESKTPHYYLRAGVDWIPNNNHTCHIGIVSNAESDAYFMETEWQGDLMLAISDGPGSKIIPVLSSYELSHSREFRAITNKSSVEAYGFIRSVYPSSRLADVVYFDFHQDVASEDFSVYGKVDIRTKEFTLYIGTLWGIITKGNYADCYLCEREGLMHIFRQSGIGESANPVVKFKLSDYIKHDKRDWYDSKFRERIIKWLENQ
ncbi:hypothetical protein [Odoribacter lunatus]|uniref:hypothetical protein n=1 Tax=Odoribacter lunatus TaxID=2941335 RepID=UPI00203D3EB9|nr:hypothetical protein [Odoribacter lunatus]